MKDLTETATFDTPITVPEGDDDMSTAAEQLEAIAQKLADRTQALKAVTDDAALKHASANDFTGQQVLQIADASLPPIVIDHGPRDDSHSLNKWKSLLQAKLTTTDQARLYSGDNTTGQVALVVNAHWDTSAQVWARDDASKPSYIFYLNSSGTWVCAGKHIGSTWTTWDSATLFADTLSANTVIGGDMQSLAEFTYTSPTSRAYRANMAAAGYPAYRDTGNGHVYFVPDVAGTYNEIAFPITMPRDASITAVYVQHNQASTEQDRFTLRCRNGDLGAILYEEVAHADATASIGTRTTTISFSPRTVHAAEDWSVVWKLGNPSNPAAVAGNYVIGIEYNITAPGPRS